MNEWGETVDVNEVIGDIVLRFDDFVSQNTYFGSETSFKDRVYEEISKLRDMYGESYNINLFREIRDMLSRYSSEKHPNRVLIEQVLVDIENKGIG